MHIRYSAAACQTDWPNPIDRRQMRSTTDRMLHLLDAAVAGAAPFLPVRLVVFPEFAHSAPVFPTVRELLDKLAVPIPNEHTERLVEKAREHDVFIQSGSMLEEDPRWPGGSQVVDFDGRIVAEASPGPGERIVVAPIDVSALRHERASRQGHHMLAHLRTEAYPVYRRHAYPAAPAAPGGASLEANQELIACAKGILNEEFS